MNYLDKELNTLKDIKEEAEQIAGEWNGDESGVLEDRANIAGDILEAVKNLEELLAELDDTDFPDADLYKDLALSR
jgi:Asp-tRNA(Asn)/Glu-tRNA(Gln) amidotransferase A subunit family amidase